VQGGRKKGGTPGETARCCNVLPGGATSTVGKGRGKKSYSPVTGGARKFQDRATRLATGWSVRGPSDGLEKSLVEDRGGIHAFTSRPRGETKSSCYLGIGRETISIGRRAATSMELCLQVVERENSLREHAYCINKHRWSCYYRPLELKIQSLQELTKYPRKRPGGSGGWAIATVIPPTKKKNFLP